MAFSIPGAPPPLPNKAVPTPRVDIAGSGAFAGKTREPPRAVQTLGQSADMSAADRQEYFQQSGSANTARQIGKLLDILT